MSDSNENKRIACRYFEMFLGGEPEAAFSNYIAEGYIQHNPNVPGEPGATIPYVKQFFSALPNLRAEIKRVLADEDLVAIHHHMTWDGNPHGIAVVDIMRFENGKIVEHWDVIQEVPEKAANSNTMF